MRKSTCHTLVAEQLGRDLRDFGIEFDTELPTMVNIIEDDNSGCKPKRNRYLKRTSSSQVDWKALEGQNMYLRYEIFSQ